MPEDEIKNVSPVSKVGHILVYSLNFVFNVDQGQLGHGWVMIESYQS